MEQRKLIERVHSSLREKGIPLYIPKRKAYSDGYCLAVWNMGLGKQKLWNIIKNTQVVLRKDGVPLYTLKKGNA